MLHFEIEATDKCNIRCLHCPHELISRPSGRMSWETFEVIIEKIRAHVKGEKYAVSFSGMGEPLLNPNIYKFVQHLSAEAFTAFSSNGSVLTEANVRKLIDVGLDTVYVSFNADEPELFKKMTGGLDFEKVLANVRKAVETTRGSRTKILANVSITKANQHRVPATKALLESLGIAPVTTSLCHSRGGFLKDEEVCDTPPPEVKTWNCDILEHTLFVDWQGKVFICAHDLAGDHPLGDLMTESLDIILERRSTLLASGKAPKICEGCNDIGRVGETFPLESGSGGIMRDWMYYLHEDHPDSLSEANEAMRWVYRIYEKKNNTALLANRLLKIEKDTHKTLMLERALFEDARTSFLHESERAQAIIKDLLHDRALLLKDQETRIADREVLVTQKESIQKSLDERDAQFAALHADYVALRKNKLWRFANMVSHDLQRLGRLFSRKPDTSKPQPPR